MDDSIIKHLASNDDVLKDIVQKIQLPEIISTQNVFHDLMSCIIEQQIHYRSTKKTFQKALEASEIALLSIQNFSVFEEKGLRNIKLSTTKYETILRILAYFKEQNIDWAKKEDKEIRQLLSQIKGVGAWTIDMILLYTLEREDIFPADDYHLKQMMQKFYPIDTSSSLKAQMKSIAEKWSPYRSVAVKYLLAWKDFQKKNPIN